MASSLRSWGEKAAPFLLPGELSVILGRSGTEALHPMKRR
jgi:hypothetical protein